ncbi:MAG: response regulator transcription factor, partial [Terriglobia bacterium]
MHLLVIEDDEPVLAFLRRSFEAEKYAVDTAADIRQGEILAQAREYDLVILGLNLPIIDGAEALQKLRHKDPSLPVIVLSSQRELEHRVRTLDMGADDYVPKPFAFSELAARARALLRRSGEGSAPILRVEDLELRRVERKARRGGKLIELTPKELALLEYLMQNAGHCVTRAMIIDHVWKLSPDTISNVVDV